MPEEITIALTGTTGHLATAVLPLLTGKGYKVKALVHKQMPVSEDPRLNLIKGSLTDAHSLDLLVEGCQVVIHCAARISLYSDKDPHVYETNFKGTINLFDAAKRDGVRKFIHVSSIHAYDQNTRDECLTEESRYCQDHAPGYDRSKRDAQVYVLQSSPDPMEVVVLNPTAVIGPFDAKPSLLGKAVMDIYSGRIPALIRGGFDFCDVRDVAAAIVTAIRQGRDRQAYLLGGKWYSLDDLQRIIMNMKGSRWRMPVLPIWAAYLGLPFTRLLALINRQEPFYTRESIQALANGHKKISSDKAARELEYNPRPLDETIQDTIQWFQNAGYLNKSRP
ncbi:MAG: hypothetical protein A2X22_06940 [Bacteroidetes bacterium GWF2_49_14]|nr:MAG: hypothetical protein A2X22_06940 [Bacteroidetes bacterium GWF2_49_14]